MTDPTLSKSSGTSFKSSDSTTLTLYNCQSENIRKVSDFMTFNMPVSDSNKALAFDLLGVRREVTLNGKVTRDDVPDIWKFSYDLIGLKQTVSVTNHDTLINGDQGTTNGYTYTCRALSDGDTENTESELYTFTVYVQNSSVDWVAGEPNTLSYSLTLIEIDASSSA